jgi:hypothetical protein
MMVVMRPTRARVISTGDNADLDEYVLTPHYQSSSASDTTLATSPAKSESASS